MNYCICAPKMYKGMIESTVSRITGFADMIQLTHLKLQQVLSRMVPDGVFVDVDGLTEVDLGNGTNYNPAEALNMYFQTGSIVGTYSRVTNFFWWTKNTKFNSNISVLFTINKRCDRFK